jgi:hypothetical protein
MAEEYRQERKKIMPEDINPDFDPANDAPPPVSEAAPIAEKKAIDLSKLPITGRVPPKFQNLLKGEPPREKNSVKTQARVTGSAELEDLIGRLTPDSSHVFEEVKLPSLGRFYDGEDGPSDGVLHIRPMTGEEEQILATPRLVRKGQAINMIFQRCIQESHRTENFLSVDRTFLLIWLRGISYSPQYEVELKCPDCDHKFPHIVDLNSLNLEMCPDDYGPPLEGVMPKSGYNFSYRLPRGRDETAIQEYRERQLRLWGAEGGTDDTLTYRTAMLVENIEGLSNKKELQQLLKKLPIQDVAYLRSQTTEPPFGVDTKIDVPCVHCMHEFSIDMPLEANFFFPRFRRPKANQ